MEKKNIRIRYRQELQNLRNSFIKMGEDCIKTVRDSVESLKNQDVELAHKVIADSQKIDKQEMEIEQLCMKLLALQQPMAADLRFIVTCLKMITDLDRIGDLSENIVEIAIKTAGKPFFKPLIDIPRMSEIAQGMIRKALDAFITGKIENLTKLSEEDDLIDGLFDQIFRELITLVIEKPSGISDATYLLFVARYLERIADHSCNLASRIIYMVTGKRVKIE
ncbi:MAG: phosphate signaling complex protein PhoU [Candidatus Jordarchaeum sp.]|uniref:phosphate signaling complex protein PhoU n=1 Tax=Candidatus Jordarchaeum sp. TaxID=2823881 RepID=UPI004049433E